MIHLIKLCVGIESLAALRTWRAERAAMGHASIVTTRHTPKRAAELSAGGSLYWVIQGQICVRQTILAITTEAQGVQPCKIALDPDLIATVPKPRRPFQGWRYLEADSAPMDLSGSSHAALPPAVARELRDIGAW